MRRILVTGGTKGIGAAVTAGLREQGHEVLTVARTNADYNFDVTTEGAWNQVRRGVEQDGITLDGLVTCAAIYGPIGRFGSIRPWHARLCIDVNLIGTMFALAACLPALQASGGRAVLMAGGGRGPVPNYAAYKASKAGVMALAESVAAEGDIDVNCVRPGFVATGFHQATLRAGEEAGELYDITQTKLAEGGRPMQEVVDLVMFLLSDRAKGITGQVLSEIPVTG